MYVVCLLHAIYMIYIIHNILTLTVTIIFMWYYNICNMKYMLHVEYNIFYIYYKSHIKYMLTVTTQSHIRYTYLYNMYIIYS